MGDRARVRIITVEREGDEQTHTVPPTHEKSVLYIHSYELIVIAPYHVIKLQTDYLYPFFFFNFDTYTLPPGEHHVGDARRSDPETRERR